MVYLSQKRGYWHDEDQCCPRYVNPCYETNAVRWTRRYSPSGSRVSLEARHMAGHCRLPWRALWKGASFRGAQVLRVLTSFVLLRIVPAWREFGSTKNTFDSMDGQVLGIEGQGVDDSCSILGGRLSSMYLVSSMEIKERIARTTTQWTNALQMEKTRSRRVLRSLGMPLKVDILTSLGRRESDTGLNPF